MNGEGLVRYDAPHGETSEEARLAQHDAMLAAMAKARAALQTARDLPEVMNIRDWMILLEEYCRRLVKDETLLRQVVEDKFWVAYKAGKMLLAMKKQHGARGVGKKKVESPGEDFTPLLERFGISRNQSSAWQKIATIPEERLRQIFTTAEKPVTMGALLAEARGRAEDGQRVGGRQHERTVEDKGRMMGRKIVMKWYRLLLLAYSSEHRRIEPKRGIQKIVDPRWLKTNRAHLLAQRNTLLLLLRKSASATAFANALASLKQARARRGSPRRTRRRRLSTAA